MNYRILEDIAIADIAFEAEGSDLENLFESCALAIMEETAELSMIDPVKEKKITIKAEDPEELLYEFLNEIVFLKDAEELIFKKVKVKIDGNKLEGKFLGEKINREKHGLKADIKAVTMHQFKLWEEGGKWKARVILDI